MNDSHGLDDVLMISHCIQFVWQVVAKHRHLQCTVTKQDKPQFEEISHLFCCFDFWGLHLLVAARLRIPPAMWAPPALGNNTCLKSYQKVPPEKEEDLTPTQWPLTQWDNLFWILGEKSHTPQHKFTPMSPSIPGCTKRPIAKSCWIHRDKHHSGQQARDLFRQINSFLEQDRKDRLPAGLKHASTATKFN